VSPPVFDDTDRIVRSDDLHRMIRRLAGVDPGPEPVLEPGELFVSERLYQTLRDGRWKIFRDRDTDAIRLVDLEADPGETRDVAASHPDVVAERTARLDTLRDALGVEDVPPLELSEDDAERLRALGYLPPARRRARP
jgi:hypothetical protein